MPRPTDAMEALGAGSHKGRVLFYDYMKGFGYICSEGNADCDEQDCNVRIIFPCLGDDVTVGTVKALQGLEVTFDIVERGDRLVVANVQPTD